jgi:hypothetical protein
MSAPAISSPGITPARKQTQVVAKAKMRSVMPAEFMMLPIRMNSGAASSGKEYADCAIFCGTMPRGKAPK